MPGRKTSDPKGVPSTAEKEKLPGERLRGVGENREVDGRFKCRTVEGGRVEIL
jgi:hypothetical protein